MFHGPFWILMAGFLIMALITIKFKGFSFIDLQLVIMIVAVSLYFDMIFCKWLEFYAYVEKTNVKAFYSIIFCLIGYPALGLTFIKFVPSSLWKVFVYTIAWSFGLTLLEILVTPFEIVLYNKWKIIPHSPLVYFLSYAWVYGYYQILKKHIRT